MGNSTNTRPLFQNYNIQNTSYQYSKYDELLKQAPKAIKTTGSTTTLSSFDSTTNAGALAPLAVNDEIVIYTDSAPTVVDRLISTDTSDDVVVISGAAINIADGRFYHYRKFITGTGATDGWVTKDPYDKVTVQIIITSLDATSIEYKIQGRNGGLAVTPTDIVPEVTKGAAFTAFHEIPQDVDEIRVGFKKTGAGTANSVSAYLHFSKLSY